MKIGIVGLDLIGGSFAKAYKKDGHTFIGTYPLAGTHNSGFMYSKNMFSGTPMLI